jgi:CheY-like chemotaxis protein
MDNARILWVDDEIHLLKPQIMVLEQKGLRVEPVSNGEDALQMIAKGDYDIVFLDENMPGLSGLETLARLKERNPHLPVVMITKSEEEHLMEEAIGSRIADYLIKPVNPTQVLSAVKKILSSRRLVSEKVNSGYQQDFRRIGMAFYDELSFDEWKDIYRKLTYWELELQQSDDKSMVDIFHTQKAEANVNFCKFTAKHYLDWVNSKPGTAGRPTLPHELLSERVLPLLDGGHSVIFLLVDCLRYDQWKTFEPIFAEYFNIESEDLTLSMLPTATQYARNAIFAGLTPLGIQEKFPKYWLNDEDEGGKNLQEANFLQELILRKRLNIKHSYHKILTPDEGRNLTDNILNLVRNDFNALVFNFIDLLAHARSEMNLIRELAPDEHALRSLSKSWLEHSALFQLVRRLAEHKVKVVLATDHGSIRVKRPIRIVGDRQTTTNLRYKQGRNLSYDEKERLIFSVRNPKEAQLPVSSLSGSYAFGMEDTFFCYPNNYNHYANYYRDTFQHGGVSIEELMVPFVVMNPKG